MKHHSLGKLLALTGIVGAGFLLFTVNANASIPDSTTDRPDSEEDIVDSVNDYVMDNGKLSSQQIAAVAKAAGFTGNDLTIAVAIALAESGGNPMAYNPEIAANTPVGLGSYGLWQIYLNKHPEFANEDLHEPTVNARAAFSIYRSAGHSFHPWSTFKFNLYQAHLNEAQQGVNA